jgi:xanthine dehydrogenase accessory factor
VTGTPKTVKVYLESTEDAVGAVVTSRNEDEIHLETNCGGMMEIFIEPYVPAQKLVIVGRGGKDDVEDALVSLGKSLAFDVVVIDHSPILSENPDRLIKDIDFDIAKFEFADSDSVVVLTRGERDLEVLQALSRLRLRYVGVLASSQRAREVIANLRESGTDEEFLASLRAPVGADIGALTSAEIALSIMAEVVAVKYGKSLPRKGAVADLGPRRVKQ